MTAPLLEVRDLAVHIGGLVAIAEMSFRVPEGQIVSLIGPNGAGKTTAFNVITGYMRPTAGRVLFAGQDITGLPPERIAARGLVRSFQRTSVFTGCTVLENALMALHGTGRAGLLGALLRSPAQRRGRPPRGKRSPCGTLAPEQLPFQLDAPSPSPSRLESSKRQRERKREGGD